MALTFESSCLSFQGRMTDFPLSGSLSFRQRTLSMSILEYSKNCSPDSGKSSWSWSQCSSWQWLIINMIIVRRKKEEKKDLLGVYLNPLKKRGIICINSHTPIRSNNCTKLKKNKVYLAKSIIYKEKVVK